MKNLKLLLVLLVSVLIINSADASAKIWYKKKCRGVKKHYNSKASITGLGFIPTCFQKRKSCYYEARSECSKNCGYAIGRYGYTSTGTYVAYTSWNSYCWGVRAGHKTALSNKLTPFIQLEGDPETFDEPISGVEITNVLLDVDEENRLLLFDQLSGKISIIKGHNQESILILKDWLSNEDLTEEEEKSEESNASNTFWSSKIYISDNEFINQIENAGSVEYIETEKGYDIVFTKLKLQVEIPAGIDIENVNIEVELDGGEIEKESVYKNAIEESNTLIEKKNIELSIFPNPTSEFLNITLSSDIDKIIDIGIYNNNGNFVFSKSVNISNNVNTIPIDITKLNSGIYYLLIENIEEIPLVKSFIIK